MNILHNIFEQKRNQIGKGEKIGKGSPEMKYQCCTWYRTKQELQKYEK